MSHDTIPDATLEQLEAAPTGSALKDGDGDRAVKTTEGYWAYDALVTRFTSRAVHDNWPPIRLTQPSRQ